MAEARGWLTTLNNSLPTGVDAGLLMNWRLAGGYSYMQLRADIGAALDAWNRDFVSAWGDLIYITDMDYLEYPNGGAVSDWTEESELDRPEGYKGDIAGHSLPLKWFSRAIGGSERFFDEARPVTIESSVQGVVTSYKNTVEKAILRRLMTNSETQIAGNAYDVGMASASATVPFTPVEVEGEAFLSSHNHYNGYDDNTADFDDMLDDLADHVLEHGRTGTGIYLVSETDVPTITAFATKFVKPTPSNVMVVAGNASAPVYVTNAPIQSRPLTGGRFFGYWDTGRGVYELRASKRIPTGYASFFLSQGNNVRMNPIYLRYHPRRGFGAWIAEVPNFDTTFPIKEIDIKMVWGVGAGEDRVAAATGRLVAGGAWTNPTIS